jgi:hypothetical protein
LTAGRAALSADETAGLQIFRGKGNCTACHVGPNFTDERLHNTGVAFRDGRLIDVGAGHGDFKTPTLRDVARTAPDMHDGSVATIEDVIELYDRGGNPNPSLDLELRTLRLTPEEKRTLATFLRTLTGDLREGSGRPDGGGPEPTFKNFFEPSENVDAAHRVTDAEAFPANQARRPGRSDTSRPPTWRRSRLHSLALPRGVA